MADEFNIVTVEDAKNYCRIKETGVSSGNTEEIDAILGTLITRASSFLMGIIGYPYLLAKDSTDTFNGNGNSVLFAKVPPINSVTSVSIDGVPTPIQSSVGGYGWLFDEDCLYLIGAKFTRGIGNVTVSWNCGITETSRKFYTAQQIILELVNIKWQQRKHPDVLLEKGTSMITTRYRNSDLTDSIQVMINSISNRIPPE